VGESTPTEAEYEVPLPLIEMGVSRLDEWAREIIVLSEAVQEYSIY